MEGAYRSSGEEGGETKEARTNLWHGEKRKQIHRAVEVYSATFAARPRAASYLQAVANKKLQKAETEN